MNTEKKSLYIETSIPSYAAARDSRDLVKFNRQILTRAFWETERQKFRLFVSQVVLDECAGGDPDAARRRREFIGGIAALQVTIDFLLSWNLTHFNAVAQTKIQHYNEKNGLWTPVLATPENIAVLVQEAV